MSASLEDVLLERYAEAGISQESTVHKRAECSAIANHQMVQKANAQWLGHILDALRHLMIMPDGMHAVAGVLAASIN